MLDNILKIITKVKNIPDKSTIMKKTGVTNYTLSKGFPYQIYNEAGVKIDVSKDMSDCYFIFNDKYANAVSGDLEVIWIVEKEEFYEYLQDEFEEDK